MGAGPRSSRGWTVLSVTQAALIAALMVLAALAVAVTLDVNALPRQCEALGTVSYAPFVSGAGWCGR
jgi:hypothetical protein